MRKKTNMADGVVLWNIRSKSDDFIINTVLCRSEIVKKDELRKKFSSMRRYVTKNPLWSEMNTMKSILYKHHNQHGKEKYFQGLKRIQKHLARLREMELESLLSSFVEKIPKKDSNLMAPNKYPCVETIKSVLFKFMGAIKLITQTMGHCKSTLNYIGGQLSMGFFIKFHVVVAASLSRFWVLLKDFLYNVIECYEKLYPWLDIMQGIYQVDKYFKADLPTCLKTWITSNELDSRPLFELQQQTSKPESLTPHTSDVLHKLFSFTPTSIQKIATPNLSDISYTEKGSPHNNIEESFEARMNSPESLLGASEPVPRQLFKDVTHNDITDLGIKNKDQENDVQGYKQLCLEQEMNAINLTSCTEAGKSGTRISKERSYSLIHYPNKKLRYSTLSGTFKTPLSCMKQSRRIIHDSKMFKSKDKLREKLQNECIQGKGNKRKRGFYKTYKKKKIFINASGNVILNEHLRTSKNENEKYQNRWKKKISLTVHQRKLKMQRPVPNVTPNGTKVFSFQNEGKDVSLSSNSDAIMDVQHVDYSKNEEQSYLSKNILSTSGKYSSTNSLQKLVVDQDLLSSTDKHGQRFNKGIQENKRCIGKNLNLLTKQVPNLKEYHQTKEDYVDNLFDVLGV